MGAHVYHVAYMDPTGTRQYLQLTNAAGSPTVLTWTGAMPVATFETSVPAAVELARLLVDGYPFACSKVDVTLANVVALRQDAWHRMGQRQLLGFEHDRRPGLRRRRQGGRCEIDHLISRELGGEDDVKNLWPQAYGTKQWNAH